MKGISRILTLGAAILVMGALGQSCMTMRPFIDDKQVAMDDYGDPSNSALVYGSATMPPLLNLSGRGAPIQCVVFMQVNPSMEPKVVTPGIAYSYFYLAPLPVGSSLKAFYLQYTYGRTIYQYRLGIQGHGPADAKITKPGLRFLGSLVLTDKGGTVARDLYPVGPDKEIDILNAMLPQFKGSAWEALIVERIKELSK